MRLGLIYKMDQSLIFEVTKLCITFSVWIFILQDSSQHKSLVTTFWIPLFQMIVILPVEQLLRQRNTITSLLGYHVSFVNLYSLPIN